MYISLHFTDGMWYGGAARDDLTICNVVLHGVLDGKFIGWERKRPATLNSIPYSMVADATIIR
jgi:hypothetical protein